MDLDDDKLKATRKLYGIYKMELEEAITILEATIGEFKYLQSTLDEDERELYEHGIQIQEIKALEIVLEALKNSIPKKKIENKIKEYMEYDKKVKTYTSDGRENFTMEYFYAKNLQELLEDK